MLFKQAALEEKDVLVNYGSLAKAWEAVTADEPLEFQFITPPSVDSLTGVRFNGIVYPPERIQASNFEELLPHLQRIRMLVVEGDGSGRGTLQFSEFEAEPVAIALDTLAEWPATDDVGSPRGASLGESGGSPRWESDRE